MSPVPLIDVAALVSGTEPARVAREIDAACRDTGFFAITGHGVDPTLCARLDVLAREFFALDDATKAEIAMARGGHAWRGWFPVGGELTSGRPDQKEGIYFGSEQPPDPRPLHGPNLFPAHPADLRRAVLEYLDALTALGHALLRGIALGLGLDAQWFDRELTNDPTILFRIFHYPPLANTDDSWSVGEHTDYGLLTVLLQDGTGGLEVRARDGWRAVPPIPGAFVCNLGDMLERMTGGTYKSTPHRVRNPSDRGRVSCAFFFDPGWDARVQAIPGVDVAGDDGTDRWDGVSVHAFSGTYGEYLIDKVAKVFPALRDEVLE